MKTEAEIRVMQPQAQLRLEPPEAERGKILGFWLPEPGE